MKTIQELIERAKDPQVQTALDDLVHDLKSQEASAINNGGFPEQITYLKESLSEGAIINALNETLNEEE